MAVKTSCCVVCDVVCGVWMWAVVEHDHNGCATLAEKPVVFHQCAVAHSMWSIATGVLQVFGEGGVHLFGGSLEDAQQRHGAQC